MDHDRPVFNQINLVVRDMAAMVGFYERLGIEIAPTIEPWDRHHRTLDTPDGLDFDLDSRAFAAVWDPGWPADRTGPVLGFRLASPETVDATYTELVRAGHTGEQAPYDAFFARGTPWCATRTATRWGS